MLAIFVWFIVIFVYVLLLFGMWTVGGIYVVFFFYCYFCFFFFKQKTAYEMARD